MTDYEVSGAPSEEERAIRLEIFVEEQGFKVEFDELDEPGKSLHLLFREGGEAAAVCRIYPSDRSGEWNIGRVAVRKKFRGGGRGRAVMAAAERECRTHGAKSTAVSAQVQARGFYESCGYAAEGKVYLDEHCPHIHMTKVLQEP